MCLLYMKLWKIYLFGKKNQVKEVCGRDELFPGSVSKKNEYTTLYHAFTIAGLMMNFAPAFLAFWASPGFKTVPTWNVIEH